MLKTPKITFPLLLGVILVMLTTITSSENNQNKEANNPDDIDVKVKMLEKTMKSEFSKISDSIMSMKKEVARLIDFNSSIQIMHDTHDQNHKDILSVSEWLYTFTEESKEKVKYIYTILQNLTDYKIVMEYDMEKIKPMIEKFIVSEEKLKTLVKRMDVTSKTLTEIQERLDKISTKTQDKGGKDGNDVKRKLDEIRQELQNLHDKVPKMEKKIDSWEDTVMSKKEAKEHIKRQIENLEGRIQTKKVGDLEIQEVSSRVNDFGKQLSKLKETLVQVNEQGDSSKISKDILTSIKFDFENDLKKLENKLKDSLLDIQNNKMNSEKSMNLLEKLNKQIDSEIEKRKSIHDDFKALKKSLGSMEDKLNSKLVTDMALQSNHFQTYISSEIGKLEATMSLKERKLTKKLVTVEETIATTLNAMEGNKETLKTLTLNQESYKSDVHKMIINLQTDLEIVSNSISMSQQQIENLQQTLSVIEGNFLRFDVAVLVFVCMGIVEFLLFIVVMKSNQSTKRQNTSNENRKTNEKIKQSLPEKDRSVCTVSFNAKGKKLHQKATEALLVDSNFTLAPSILIKSDSEIEDTSSLVVLVFIDNNEKVNGTDDVKWKTVQSIDKMGGHAFVVIFGDSGSKQLPEDEIVNSKLLKNNQFDWRQLVLKKRIYSVFKDFNEFQKEQLLAEFAELL